MRPLRKKAPKWKRVPIFDVPRGASRLVWDTVFVHYSFISFPFVHTQPSSQDHTIVKSNQLKKIAKHTDFFSRLK